MNLTALPLAILLLLLPAVAQAEPPSLRLPIACTVGEDCFIQNLPDTDPGPGFRDYACGSLGYDGDTGADFRLPDLEAMRRGVPVLAAAPGTVLRLRDGEPDTGRPPEGEASLQGRTAGNSVIIDHGDGWTTQYSHLRQGSVRVKPGDTVAAGDPLALIGLSGNTQFPHVEMIVRKGDMVVDPFLGEAGFQGCDGPRRPLWAPEVAGQVAYRPTGLIQAGFANGPVDFARARDGAYEADTLPVASPALTIWAELFGLRAGDRLGFRIFAPDGSVWFETKPDAAQGGEIVFDRNRAVHIAFAGRRAPPGGLAPGAYRGIVFVKRGDKLVVDGRVAVKLVP